MNWPAEDLWLAMVAKQPGLTIEVLPAIDSTNTDSCVVRAQAKPNRCYWWRKPKPQAVVAWVARGMARWAMR